MEINKAAPPEGAHVSCTHRSGRKNKSYCNYMENRLSMYDFLNTKFFNCHVLLYTYPVAAVAATRPFSGAAA